MSDSVVVYEAKIRGIRIDNQGKSVELSKAGDEVRLSSVVRNVSIQTMEE
ncbi:hypothetical protein GCM10027592_49920 [Spirosoma flavus]